jgi:Metallo-beta-lactamase superfamily
VLAAAGYADDRGANAVVIFDGQLLLPYANEVAPYVQTLGKPIDRTILSHAHTDHWGGLQVLAERFPDARVFALDAPEAQCGSMAYAVLTATGPLRKSPSRRRQSPKAHSGSTARPPRGTLIPRSFRASAICRNDVAPMRCNWRCFGFRERVHALQRID